MRIVSLACFAAALGCTLAAQAANPLSEEEVKAHKVRIEEQYDNAQMRCRRVEGHARELCNERARGERDIQSAEVRLQAQPTAENDEKLRLAKAEASYSTALIQCKTMEGSSRDACRSAAKMVFEDARRDAKLQKEVMQQVYAAENAVRLRTAEADRIAEAQFAQARARCEALPPEGRAPCLEDAKTKFGRL
jgi:glycerate-2-kinase